MLTGGILLVAGCGSDDADDSRDGADTESDARAGEGESFPVTIEHTYGSTTVSEQPERVATVGLMDQDALLALGIVPVATTEWFGEQPGAIWPWATDELEALGGETPVVVGASDEINFEGIAAREPDLILALYSGITEEDYQRLTEIAPTVAHPEGQVDYGIGWEELTRTAGQAVGMPDEAEALIEDVQARFETARAEHPEFAGATAVMATPYEGVFVYGPEDPRSRFLSLLGFELPDGLAEVTGDEFGANLSEEQADLLDVDTIVWIDPGDVDQLGGPLYQSLPVHTEGREVFVESADPLGAATSFVTVLSLPFLLDELVPKLADAVP
ncbi:iron-siderophore ABC transporter substrate-binding protein [Phytoactinopolyspora halotolerans]|uniref:Iron-siderophore ABC transporter substrate-binding protein n=1 Tax=Phytoactinopolyspora halotolerans TaxID=1981512 RepID=A0A6L9SHM2_9ACTN|nr:iron-siderophore ABC transporter substrate-binding protein [Phytoactinopolyspora halotolerans]NEE04627.1 iron-siderophore ABC transporter substrate-binding protein [Phytoactinopolyspora halotolerans]